MAPNGVVPRLAAAGAIGIATIALLTHAAAASGGTYLNFVSGIWLALARDLQGGVFYREVFGELGYGGTRYFPLFFTLIAVFLRAGADALTAGWVASGVAAAVLAAGMFRLVRSLGGTALIAGLFAAASLSPYFVQQTLFELRADVMAAALNVWGLAFLAPAFLSDRTRTGAPGLSALCFTLALATKVTSAAIPGAAIAGLVLAGRPRLAAGLLWRLAAGTIIFFAGVHWASEGRALASWRACMFAGTDAGGTLALLASGEFFRLITYSRLLLALLVIVAGALTAAWFYADRRAGAAWAGSLWFPTTLLAGASASTALALSSPGTVPSNQMVEWIQVVLVILAFLVCAQPRLTRVLTLVVAFVTLWASAQDVKRAREIFDARAQHDDAGDRQRLLSRVATQAGPVLSDSALWTVLAQRESYMLDPFALRVVMQSRKDVELDLKGKIERRVFALVILQADPTTPAGRGWYENVNLGWPITETILAHYRLDSHPLRDVYVYVPRN